MTLFKKAADIINRLLEIAANSGPTSCAESVGTPSVNELKNLGYKVRVTHLRNYFDAYAEYFFKWKTTKELREMKELGKYNCNKLSQWGGATVVQLSKDNEDKFGVAVCSEMDNFNRRLGLSLAIERALS